MMNTNPGINQMRKAVFKQEHLSEKVVYQYWDTSGKRTVEALVASERYYPGVLVNKRFYYGITAGNRFIPGIIWCNHFIPGLVTKRVFVPGIIIDNVFKPGVISAGIFLPGIVSNSTFVPGVIKDKHFIPGCHTTDQLFAPGRIWNRQFESGIAEKDVFIRTNKAKLFQEEVSSLPREKYGMTQIRRFDPIGGVPIKGMILGEFDDGQPWYLPCGLLTDDGLVLGGVPVFDDQYYPPQHKPGAELDDLLDKLGINKYGVDFGDTKDKGEELIKNVEDLFDSMLGTGNPFKPTGSAGKSLAEAFEALGQGTSDFIDGLNEDYNNYWQQRLNNNASGWIRGENDDKVVAVLGVYGAYAGYLMTKLPQGAAGGAALGYLIAKLLIGTCGSLDKPPTPPPGTKQPGEGGAGGSNTVLFGRGLVGPEGLYSKIKGPRDRKIYEWKNTECGRVLVVDREALRKAVISAPQGSNLGLNLLTGQTTWAHQEPPTAKEIQDHTVLEMLKEIVTEPIFHPI